LGQIRAARFVITLRDKFRLSPEDNPLCNLCVLCASVVSAYQRQTHLGNTEDTENL